MKSNYIYHFTRLQTAIEKILPNMQLRANYLKDTNDPRETYLWTFGGKNVTKKDESYSIETPFRLGYEVKQHCKVICFTKGPDGFRNEMMWSHYGNNHAGICLEIDENTFIKENKAILDNYIYYFKKVNYDIYSYENKPSFERENEQDYDEALINFIKINHEVLFFQKSKYWEKENEKRLIIISKKFDSFLSIRNSLKRVIIGIYCFEKYLPTLENLIKNTNIEIFQCIFGIDVPLITVAKRERGEYCEHISKKYLNKYKY